MNAIQPSRPPLQPVESRRVAQSRHRQKRNRANTAIALETTAKLTVNILLSSAAIVALVQLLPYHKSVQTKLQEIRGQVQQKEERVNRLQTDFGNLFDPKQAKTNMQDLSSRVDPARRKIVLLDKDTQEPEEAEQAASSP
ncbi:MULTISPECIES: hypothetical protein [Aerosakkonema]|uniref:Uncharacterized protein n=1 Tax=Aerosakkonema funiforme FACHB-1375 TaxID=2949571 RepID=A0A926VJH6_9CYAN|nr:hypothetical protein [Aerosakkonema funiforme]MBD2183867.1 hypothetical protein [Aerosakkonema funiforme FACHB-1375]